MMCINFSYTLVSMNYKQDIDFFYMYDAAFNQCLMAE